MATACQHCLRSLNGERTVHETRRDVQCVALAHLSCRVEFLRRQGRYFWTCPTCHEVIQPKRPLTERIARRILPVAFVAIPVLGTFLDLSFEERSLLFWSWISVTALMTHVYLYEPEPDLRIELAID